MEEVGVENALSEDHAAVRVTCHLKRAVARSTPSTGLLCLVRKTLDYSLLQHPAPHAAADGKSLNFGC